MRHRNAGLAAAAILLYLLAQPVFAMSDIDRRLNVAVVGFAFDESAAKSALVAGANVNHRNEAIGNATLLIQAIQAFKEPGVVAFLLANGADPTLTDNSGRTALDYARQYGIGNSPGGRAVLSQLEAASGGQRRAAATSLTGAQQAPATAAAPNAAADPPRTSAGGRGQAAAVPQAPAAPAPPGTSETAASPLKPGVYECYGQNAMISPMAFGIVDETTYMNSMGRRGRYSYDGATGVLTLDAGSAETARYKKVAADSFRPLLDNGALGGFACPLNPRKNPQRPPW